ncbi:MAG: hypothetical protein ABI425_02045 [Patescibacteria group bacterium]
MQFANVLAQKISSSEIVEKYFTCLIEDSFVTLAIWGVVNGRPKVLSIGTPKEWLELISLSDAVELGLEEFHEEAEGVTKVLFSLPQEWVTPADIKPEYKEVLKKITQKLVLHPVGFVVTLEALFHFIFQFKTSAALTLYLQVCANEYRLFLTEHGQLLQKETMGRSDKFVDDLIEGLSRLEKQPLPAQMYFFSFEVPMDQLEQDKQTFLAHDWDTTKLFHHLPSIDILSRSDMVEAACIAGGSETLHTELTPVDTHQESSVVAVKPVHTEDTDFGFTAMDQPTESAKVSSFGIPMPSKVVKSMEPPTSAEVEPEYAIDESVIDAEYAEQPAKAAFKFKLPKFKLPVFALPAVFSRSSIASDPSAETPTRRLFPRKNTRTIGILGVVVGGFLLVMAAGVYGWVVIQRVANVEIILKTIPVSVDAKVALNPNIPVTDAEKKVLKVSIVNKEETDNQETSTHGSKIIGENAKGTVTILNKTTSLKTIAKGTEIKSGTKLFFTDQDVTVASASTQENDNGQTVQYGKKDVSVTAKEIGAESNLDKDTDFSVGNFGKDTYTARNDKAIAGGSSREIQAVSKEDQQKLETDLKKSLMKKAESEMKSGLASGDYLVLSGKSQVKKETFSAKVGEETEKLTLTMTLSVEAYTYKSSDLQPIAREQLAGLVPDGGALIENKISILSKESQNATSSASLTLDATLTSEYVPPTNSEAWLDDIKGKTLEQARQILSEKAEIKSSTIHLSPGIAEFLVARLPDDKKKITLKKKVE